MIAKIKGDKGVYNAFIFGYDRNKIVVLDERLEELICVDYWNSFHSRNVLITDYDLSNYAYNTDSYKAYWNDKNIIKTITDKKYTKEMLEEAKLIQNNLCNDKWIKLKSKNEFDSLMESSSSFHDSYILYLKQEEDVLEVLFDTTWNAFIKLRCKGIIKNYLTTDDYFSHAYYEILDDRVKIVFDSFNYDDDIILEAKEIEFIAYHEYRYVFTDYKMSDDEIVFYNQKNIVKSIKYDDLVVNAIVDDNIVGIIKPSYDEYEITLFLEDYYITFKNSNYKDDDDKYQTLIDDIILNFNEFGLNLYKNIDYFEFEPDYGDVIYEEIHKKRFGFIYIFKCILIPMICNILFWLIIQLLNPQMKWIIFYIMGLGVSIFTFIIALITYLKEYNFPWSIKLCERGIIQKGLNDFTIDYKLIDLMTIKTKKIILKTKWGGKFTITSCNNIEYVYNLIEERIKLAKEAQ